MRSKCTAHANLALIKYWGKRDPDLILPTAPSISVTLDRFFTETEIEISDEITESVFLLDGKSEGSGRALKYVEKLFGMFGRPEQRFIARSHNSVPADAGFSSSSSAFASMAGAVCQIFGCEKDPFLVSRMARLGSGSATRSVFPGLVEWKTGDDESSHGYPLENTHSLDFKLIAVLMDPTKKKTGSRAGMNSALKSPLYPEWIKETESDCEEMKKAIAAGDFASLGALAEKNAQAMDRLNLTVGLDYLSPRTRETIGWVKDLRRQGFSCYVSFDAGNNFFIIAPSSQAPKIAEMVQSKADVKCIILGFGPGLSFERKE